jgi:hypothetical protein
VVFTKTHIYVMDGQKIILTGNCNPVSKLWQIKLRQSDNNLENLQTPTTIHHANNVYELKKQADIITYLHQAACSPVPSTWCKAIDAGYFSTWPGLTSDLVRKHLPKSLSTAKGHLRQDGQGLPSTKTSDVAPHTSTPDQTSMPAERTGWVFTQPIPVTGKIFTDQTGRFPITSSRGNKYVMICYDYDSNNIIAEPLKSRTELELLRAYTKIHNKLSVGGLKPKITQKIHARQRRQLSIGPTTLPWTQRRRTRHPNLEGTLHHHSQQHQSQLSVAPLVPSHRPSLAHSHPPTPVSHQSQVVQRGTTKWTV